MEPLLLVTANDIFVLGVASLLNPIAPGLINIVCAAEESSPTVEITSAITPEPGVGSAPSALLASVDLAAVLT